MRLLLPWVMTAVLTLAMATAGAQGAAAAPGDKAAAPGDRAAVTLRIVQGDNQSATARSSFPNQLEVLVHDDDPDALGPVAGAVVTFTVTAGSAVLEGGQSSVQVTTDSDGLAAYPLTAGRTPGPVIVMVTSSATGSAAVQFAETVLPPVVLAVSELSGNGQSAGFRDDFAEPLVVGVWDEFGDPVVGTVTFSIVAIEYGGAASFPGGAQTAQVTIDALGRAASPVLTAGTSPGPLEIVASYDPAAADAIFDGLEVVYPTPASITASGGEAQSAVVATEFADPLTVRVLDDHGFPLTGPPPTVTYEVVGGSATFPGDTGNAQSQATIEGYATSPPLTAGTQAGPVTVLAEVFGTSTRLTASFTATVEPVVPSGITAVSGSGQSVLASTPGIDTFFSSLTVLVVDQLNRPMPLVDVAFTVSGPASFAGPETTTGQTGLDGTATISSLVAGLTGGNVIVTAAVDGLGSTAQFSETVQARVPSLIVATSGSNQTAAPSTPFGKPLVALVLDQRNTLRSGVPVVFTVTGPATFDGASSTMVVSDNNGTATAPPLVAGSSTGPVSVTASASGAIAAVFVETVTGVALIGQDDQNPPPPGAQAPVPPARNQPGPPVISYSSGQQQAQPSVYTTPGVYPTAYPARKLAVTGIPLGQLIAGGGLFLLAGLALMVRVRRVRSGLDDQAATDC